MPSFRDSPGPAPVAATNHVLDRDQSQWLFTPEELLCSPSILDGMSQKKELENRQKGVNFITQVGIMLKLPQLTLATASVYLHRLFMRQKMPTDRSAGLHHYSAAATALFLATKTEENCRKMKELVVACCRVAQKQPNLVVDEQNKEYWKWRDTVLHNEDILLEALCFDLQLEQPYRILFEFLQYYGVQDNKSLRNASWAFLNDSHVTTMCLLHSSRVIAGAALYTGIKLANITLPDDEDRRPWWEHLELGVLDIQSACNTMFDAYETASLPRVGAKDAYTTRENDMAFLDKTRGLPSPLPDMSPRSIRSTSQLSGTKRDRDDNSQEDEWGAPSRAPPVAQSVRSPKRQRVDTPDQPTPPVQQGSRIPPAAGSRIPPAANGGSRVPTRIPHSAASASSNNSHPVDDVQQRIDDIVNASSGGAGSRVPPGARIPQRDQHGWSNAPPHRGSRDEGREGRQSRPRSRNGNEQHESRRGSRQDEQDETVGRVNGSAASVPPVKEEPPDEGDAGSEEGEL